MHLLALTLLLLAGPQKPEFEAASIHPTSPESRGTMMRGGPGSNDPGRISYRGITLWNLVLNAYNLKRFQLQSPAWMETTRLDVTAKIPEGATRADLQLMLQSLLAERFKLVVHREQKEMAVYELVVGKGGHKLKTSPENRPDDPPAPADAPKQGQADKDGYPYMGPGGGMIMNQFGARYQARDQTMEGLARFMSGQMNRQITDATGIPGKFDFNLVWSPGENTGKAGDEELKPAFLPAVQEQLGLRLETKRGTVEIVVVDSCEKIPSEN